MRSYQHHRNHPTSQSHTDIGRTHYLPRTVRCYSLFLCKGFQHLTQEKRVIVITELDHIKFNILSDTNKSERNILRQSLTRHILFDVKMNR